MQAPLNNNDDFGGTTEQHQILNRCVFQRRVWEQLREALKKGRFGKHYNYIAGSLEPVMTDDVLSSTAVETEQAQHFMQLGKTALAAGQVGVLILNGGMATRFGGVVKGVVEVFDEKSFLNLKLAQIVGLNAPVPVFLMNSFATLQATQEHLREQNFVGMDENHIHMLEQGVSVRLKPDGSVFYEQEGQLSLYAPGHGEIFAVLKRSSAFQEFIAQGGKLVLVVNVDNLGATLSPLLVGMALADQHHVMTEVVAACPGETGGVIAAVDGHREIVEGFRLSEAQKSQHWPLFNTNTLWLKTALWQQDFELTWFRADKCLAGQDVVQFEQLMGQVTAVIDSQYVVVPRDGKASRFLPIKTPDDLKQMRKLLRQMYAS